MRNRSCKNGFGMTERRPLRVVVVFTIAMVSQRTVIGGCRSTPACSRLRIRRCGVDGGGQKVAAATIAVGLSEAPAAASVRLPLFGLVILALNAVSISSASRLVALRFRPDARDAGRMTLDEGAVVVVGVEAAAAAERLIAAVA